MITRAVDQGRAKRRLRGIRAATEAVLETEAFDPVYQPVRNLGDRSVVGFEALTRFHSGRSPHDVFADAAAAGLGVELELLAVRKAIGRLGDLPDNVWLSVNVSPDALRSEALFASLRGVPMRRLVFELTEHARIDDYDEFIAVLRKLASRGVRLAVDDAGAGYASLRHILALHPKTIKLDISLTRDLHKDVTRRALTAALCSFAQTLDATVIAEGIESEEEVDALRHIGVRFGQGYYLGRPGPLGPASVVGAP